MGRCVGVAGTLVGGNRVGELMIEHASNKNEQSTKVRSSFIAFPSLIILLL
jgi:hypothetical protein